MQMVRVLFLEVQHQKKEKRENQMEVKTEKKKRRGKSFGSC